jgi:23S rRNA (cytidine1920-2'-O)/16S rRNA (cytidine1409-2'-O)-methyltransferase
MKAGISYPSNEAAGQRLDQVLVARGLYATRSRARDAIARGCVSVNGRTAAKAAMIVGDDDRIATADEAAEYVGRGALKLKAALEASGYSPSGRVAIDLGASTGGFTQVLLEAGARKVFAIDVGHGQLDDRIAADPRVVNIEGLNARDLDASHLAGEAPGFVVADLSFISLRIAAAPALALAARGALAILLVKPQFEAGREHVGKGGLVRDPQVAQRCAHELFEWLDKQPGWRATLLMDSPVSGGDGNREFLIAGVKDR